MDSVEAGVVWGWACLRGSPAEAVQVWCLHVQLAQSQPHAMSMAACQECNALQEAHGIAGHDSRCTCCRWAGQVLIYVDGVKVGETGGGENTPHLLINRLCEGETSDSDGSVSTHLGFRHQLPALAPGRHEVGMQVSDWLVSIGAIPPWTTCNSVSASCQSVCLKL